MRWVYGIIAFFVVIVVINVLVVYFALTSSNGLIEDHPYERGLAYQNEIDKLSDAKTLAWEPKLNLLDNVLQITIRNPNGELINGLQISLWADYPADSTRDFNISFNEIEPGVYAAEAPENSKLGQTSESLWMFRLAANYSKKELLWKFKKVL